MNYKIRFKGGPGSGFHGHKGRLGEQGGSLPEGSQRSSVDKYSIPDYSKWDSQKTKFGVDYNIKVGKYKFSITHMSDGSIRGRIEDTSLDFSDNNRISDTNYKAGSEQALLYKFRSRLEGLNSGRRNIHGDFVS